MRAVDAAGAAPGLGAVYARGFVPMVMSILTLASGATDALRWAACQ